MMFDLFSRPTKEQRRAPTGPRPGVTSFRPQLEAIEDRVVPANLISGNAVVITDVNLGNLSIVDPDPTVVGDEILKATEGTVKGTLAGLPFTTNITDFALKLTPDDPATPQKECSVLNLELAPIDVDLLGLHVDTSAICLEVTATEGGGLLGDLLCSIAGGLPTVPNLPVLSELSGGLGDLIDGALTTVLTTGGAPAGPGVEDICDGDLEILDVALGPVDLSLLGLNVALDDCTGGPVQVCVSASEGQGLLGDLLTGLLGGGGLPDLDPDLGKNLTQKDINKIVKTAERLMADGELSFQDVTKLVRLVNRLSRR